MESGMDSHYQADKIELVVQNSWNESSTFKVQEDSQREKYYCLSMFPYPSGRLHMGHVRNYTLGDVIARIMRMHGKNVLQPMGWDAFGLPAENAAIAHQLAPAEWTRKNIEIMRAQFQRLGFGYDWSRELATCDSDYYRWEQWLFTRLLEKGLVYRKTSLVNWCPEDQTVLANEQVEEGRCWRCNTLVERREIPQWFMRITDYADELLEQLETLDQWPEQVVTMQRNWIGRSEGLEIHFPLQTDVPASVGDDLRVYTTRPDTLMGVTYVAIALEHPLALWVAEKNPQLADFLRENTLGKVSEAALETMEKKGMDSGLQVLHPVSGEVVPLWVANFVLMGYGSGAVMSVPAHDHRDHAFALKYGLPIKPVVFPVDGDAPDTQQVAYTEKGVLRQAGEFDGLDFKAAFAAIAAYLEQRNLGRKRVNYRLRDWGISRQRYWGCPIPVIYCEACGVVPVPEEDLPVKLPEVALDGVGSPLPELADFVHVDCPRCAKPARRETDTFDTFFESSWYFARYTCPDQSHKMLDERADYWLPVDQYVGGIEHAILHLLYARFFQKLMRDEGLVKQTEPFSRLLTQGMVLKDGVKMSKSRGNTVDPQALIDQYGADTIRLFIMFAAPPEQSLEWSDSGVEGASRFLKRLWKATYTHVNAVVSDLVDTETLTADEKGFRRQLHLCIQKVTHDMKERRTFNTAIAAVMELMNVLLKLSDSPARSALRQEALEAVVLMLSPIVPHITQVLWQALGHAGMVVDCTWPVVDESALLSETVKLVIQVNGKLRGHLEVGVNESKAHIIAQALNEPNILRFIAQATVLKTIVVPGRLVNIVIKP